MMINGADLSNADVREARLAGAGLKRAFITPEQLSQAWVERYSL